MNKFSKRLAELRKEANLTTRQLGEKIGVANTTISSWELGHSEPTLGNIINLADFFSVNADYLIGRKDDY